MNLTPALNVAAFLLQKYLDSKKQAGESAVGLPEGVTERVLDDSYFHAMADDIRGRVEKGEELQQALKQIHTEQGAVLLRPAPEPSAEESSWIIPAAAGALIGIGIVAWVITQRKQA